MLTSLTLRNFKSYQEATLSLAPITFLIGANASGKSNALEAIRLLSWLAKGSRLDDIERNIQSGNAIARGQAIDLFGAEKQYFTLGTHIDNAPDGWTDFEIEIGLLSDQLIIIGESVSKASKDQELTLYKIDGDPNSHTDEISVTYNNFNKGGKKPHIPCSNRQAIFYQLETPSRFQQNHTQSQKIIPAVTKVIRETLRNIVFLDPRPAVMRDYAYAKYDDIKEDGSNLSSVLYAVCQQGETQKNKLLDFIRSLPEQDITDIRFIITDRKDVMVKLIESFGNKEHQIDAPLLSDGTLRVLAIAATLLSVNPGTFVIIEEIDNGVHPSRADNLVKQIREIALERKLRVLITSHNPALLDAVPDSDIGNVLCCYRDPQAGDSRIVRLADLERFPELIVQGTLGQLMTKQVLDKFLKDKSTAEQRQQNALSWLEQLKQGEVA
ncbi:MAG: AAA family ATPase [Microcystis sp. M114S2]|uniref:AAA family ATPase n=1 Tax=unclassified Microcystis TaxID=2643300 RepID=UPI002582D1AD|nr:MULTISPECIES: ATP-binding protein [unclassified Microcystis]MCA2665969.1 AAA family ATPase [Microcystis sp. M045S2]MCA2714705.1 AAA family ATPase [Microcystis sp. M172S2]MCA2803303.1 AAA family ATPase [Microcystis sp. M114S2]MCA2832349.1 AAA family ATPase [Microcystis sp. M007S1]MCA2838076.1 AAA family ATPase [Microcystis sp. M078S1]